MKELETLLNSLIQMGWKPGGHDVDLCDLSNIRKKFIQQTGRIMFMCSLRELVSLESGLWQIAAQKGLLKSVENEWSFNPVISFNDLEYQYRLLESALVPEEELGQFLLENIKTE